MNTFNQLTRTLKRWYKDTQNQGIINGLSQNKLVKSLQNTSFQVASDLNQKIFSSKPVYTIHPPFMFGLAVLSLTSIVGYRYYNQPQLAVGTLSPMTIMAPEDGRFEDPKTTATNRKAAETSIVPILKRDSSKTIELRVSISQIFEQIQQYRESAGAFPFVSTNFLSIEAQNYLRDCPDREWQIIMTQLAAPSESKPQQVLPPIGQRAILQLEKERKNLSDEAFEENFTKTKESRQQYQKFKEFLPSNPLSLLTRSDILLLVNLTETEWQHTKQQTLEAVHRILTQGIHPGFPPSLLKETINTQLSTQLPKTVNTLIPNLLTKILENEANLITDEEATLIIAKQASEAVETSFVEIQKNEIIVKAGEKITQETFVLLDGFGLSQRSVNWLGLGKSAILVTGGVLIFCFIAKRGHTSFRRRDHVLLWLLSLSTPILGIISPNYLNLPMVGALTSSFYNPTLAINQVVILAGFSAFAEDNPQWDYLLSGTLGGLLAAAVAGRLRSRDELAFLGTGVGLVQGSVYLLLLWLGAASGGISYPLWYLLLPKGLFYGSVGMVWTILAIGLSPYLERLFDLITPIRLVELANPNCTLLKRLQTEAPGTFQHTLFVACLAEAAARELNCNVELVRAGTLYHDIGKMHDPLGFIENQMGGPNKHDEINDPWVSVEIIKKHVSEGLTMAKQYGLPKMIQAFIPEHQGKLLISYFYYQAKQQAETDGKDPILEEDFRYVGPIPQSRETAIVMLADGCEAALRSLQESTPEEALALIKKIFKARWRDGQLEDCGLTYEELPLIADIFVRVWQQFHHKRIAYPKAALEIKV
jgi:putative nucleotidyltransferase with HDIG domain